MMTHALTYSKAAGKIEIHIPQCYDEQKPAIVWSHDDRQQSIRENELARRLPEYAKALHPTLYEDASAFESLVARPGRPTKLEQWIEQGHPGLSVHVVSFTDATLVTLSWNHVFFDALGRQDFLLAWQAVMNGKDDEVPTFIPYEEDPLVCLAQDADPRDHVLYGLALTGIWFVLFVMSFIYEVVVHSKEAGRMVRFPKAWVDNLREEAMAELRTKGVAEKDVFLSHGDVLLAFWAKITLAAQRLRPSQPLYMINAMNLRGASDEVPVPGKVAYIGNAAMGSITMSTAAEIEKLSVSELASRIREDLRRQRAPDQVKAQVAWQLQCYMKGARAPMAGRWNQLVFSWSNWSRAKFFDVDFSSAVVKAGLPDNKRSTKVGQPSLVMNGGHTNGISLRNGGPLIGQDANGDWWANWVMRAEAWPQVQKALSEA